MRIVNFKFQMANWGRQIAVSILVVICFMLLGAGETLAQQEQGMAILEFEDLSKPLRPDGQEVVKKALTRIFEAEFKMADSETCRRVFSLDSQKEVGPITPRRAALLGRTLQVDVLVAGNYTLFDDGSLIINAAFINTHFEQSPSFISNLMTCLEKGYLIDGMVGEIKGDEFILDIGKNAGLELGTKFLIWHSGLRIGEGVVAKLKDDTCVLLVTKGQKPQLHDAVTRAVLDLEEGVEAKRFLMLNSLPQNAQAYINETKAGISPLIIRNIPSKEITLGLKKDGYQPRHLAAKFYEPVYCLLSLCLMDLKLSKETKPSMPTTGSLLITSNPSSAFVYLGQEIKGVTPILLPELEPGFCQIKVTKPGFKSEAQKIIIEPGRQQKVYLNLEREMPPLPPPKPCFELLAVATPHLIEKGQVEIGLKYPEILILRAGTPIDGLEFRICGLGIGLKRSLTKNLSLDIYYNGYEIRKWEEGEGGGASFILGLPVKLPFGQSWFYLGGGYYCRESKDEPRYFAGLESQLTYDLSLLLEYDRIDGSGLGIKFPLCKHLKFVSGIGKDKEKEWRFDVGLFYEED